MTGSASAPRLWRAVSATVIAAGAAAAALWFFWWVATSSWARTTPPLSADPDAVLAVVGLLGMLVTAWLSVAVVAALVAQLPGAAGRAAGQLAHRCAPRVVRRVAAIVVGTALATAITPAAGWAATGAAAAAPVRQVLALQSDPLPDPGFRPSDEAFPAEPVTATPSAGPATTQLAPDGPDRTSPTATPGTSPAGPNDPSPAAIRDSSEADSPELPGPGFTPAAPPAATPATTGIDPLQTAPRVLAGDSTLDEHVVRRGDTLWDIAAAHLGAGAAPSAIAEEWPRWYAANRQVIGPDPAHIVPGQRLVPPPDSGSPDAGSPGAPRAHLAVAP